MPRGGSKPGERRGGRQRGTKNRKTLEREALAARLMQDAPAELIGSASGLLAKDVLRFWMHTFDRLARHHKRRDPAKAKQYAASAIECARFLAPYQSATYRAVLLPVPPPQGETRIPKDELARKLEERGLPSFVFGIDVPTLEPEPTMENDHEKIRHLY
jgi:hypothetical protein